MISLAVVAGTIPRSIGRTRRSGITGYGPTPPMSTPERTFAFTRAFTVRGCAAVAGFSAGQSRLSQRCLVITQLRKHVGAFGDHNDSGSVLQASH